MVSASERRIGGMHLGAAGIRCPSVGRSAGGIDSFFAQREYANAIPGQAGGFPTMPMPIPAHNSPAPDGMPSQPALRNLQLADNHHGPGNVMQSPTGTYPRRLSRRLRAAGPAAARQRPNLGAYGGSPFTTVDRPNANPGIGGGMLGGGMNSPRGQGGAPVATALDLSRLFGGGQPAVPAAAPAAVPRPPVYNQPSIRMVPPAIPIGGGAGNVMEAPTGTPRRKGSSSSQGGGY